MPFFRLLQVCLIACTSYFLQGCQVFIHDSFDTFQGVVVDESGNPIANIKLTLYSNSGNYFGNSSQGSLLGNRALTNAQGEFKLVLPSRYREDNYYLVPPSNLAFKVGEIGAETKVKELLIQTILNDQNRVIDLGKITVVAE
jgi:hypothetical protein